ncbi:hypothetical protein [Brachyspira hampsonii]|uniref:Uncharacterized protein n=1 Tax=Brachyspira hampsonii 30446 TaxID=1289135 RepID=A0A2U4EU77_9SPIR|nr:hypothetical protein [Brachyspira hampsonii]EKV56148.1 hypothetical protein A966_12346 [Brachyspira hampsonii 30446]
MIDDNFIKQLKKDETITLFDSQTKVFIYALDDIYIITVDKGIISDNIKKCDYLAYRKYDRTCFIELKGKKIDEAYNQITSSVHHISNNEDLSFLINDVKILYAYIISKENNRIPKGINSKKRELATILYRKSKEKSKINNYLDLVKYVKTVSNNDKRESSDENNLICSSKKPLKL